MRIASWILVFVAIGSAAAAWFTPREIEAGDAKRVALGAMNAAGIGGSEVNEPITLGVHIPNPDGEGEISDDESDQPEAGSTSAADDDDAGTLVADAAESRQAPVDGDTASEPKDAWIVLVDVGDDTIEFRIDENAGELLYVDDLVGPDQQERFFTDEQWETVRHHRDGKLSSWVGRNAMGSMAAVLIVGAGFVLAKRSDLIGAPKSG